MWWVSLLLCCARPTPPQAPAPEVEPRTEAEARVWYLRAVVAAERGDADEAERALSWTLRLDDSDEALAHAAEVALSVGRPEAARRWADQWLSRRPDDPRARRLSGLAAWACGDALAARERLAGLPGVGATRIRAAVALGDEGGAREELAAWWGLSVPPDERRERAEVSLELGEPQEALRDALVLLEAPEPEPADLALALRATLRTCDPGPLLGLLGLRPDLADRAELRPMLRSLAAFSGDPALAARVDPAGSGAVRSLDPSLAREVEEAGPRCPALGDR